MESLTCGYGGAEPVLRDVDLEFSSDDGLVCIVGPNGVGKSTLVRCIDNLVPPVSGRVTIDGRDVSGIPRGELADMVGYVQAVQPVSTGATVFETVSMGRYNRMRWRMGAEDLEAVSRAMEALGLTGMADEPVCELSAGQQQRVMIARGLVQGTGMLILDEPTSNLDVRAQLFVASLLRGIAHGDGKLVLMICHDINIASKTADRILMLAEPGRVLAYGTPEEVVTEENMRGAYGVGCDVVVHEGRPHVMVRSDSV